MSYTATALVAGLTALTVTGVKRKYGAPPNQPLTTGDLPALYPRLPRLSGGVESLAGDAGLTSVTVDLVIAVQPLTQRTNARNYALALTMTDALAAALAGATLDLGIDAWTVQVEEEWQGDTGMWVVIGTVQASG